MLIEHFLVGKIWFMAVLFIWLVPVQDGIAQILAADNFQRHVVENVNLDNVLLTEDMKEVPLDEAIRQIGQEAGVTFNYNSKILSSGEKVSYRANRVTLAKALDDILSPDIDYMAVRNIIILKSNSNENRLDLLQEIVQGVVVDNESGNPLPGVNVIVKGTTIGTSTDIDGQFDVTVESLQDTLIFSYIGYTNQEVPLNGSSVIEIQLMAQAIEGEEMVVTAFGVERESRQINYATQEIQGEQVAAVGNTNIVNSLQGKIAGVTIRQTSGAPGSSHRINIRGTRSLTGGNEPLYVIDGLPVSGGSRAIDINPSDIESINVLKGPSASALYGLRASNGVVVIETKRGSGAVGDGPRISFDTNYSIQEISMLPEIQTTYMQGENGQFNPFSTHSWGPRIDTTDTYINQLGEVEVPAAYNNAKTYFQTGGISNTSLSISNALDRGNYAISLGYTDHEGIMKNTGMQRMNMKVAGDYDLYDNFRISTSINLTNSHIDEQPTGTGSGWWSAFAVPISYNLAEKPTHVPGNPYQQINFRGAHDNLIWMNENNYRDNETSRILGNLNLNYNPLDWLMVNYRIGLDGYTNNVKTVLELGSGPGRTVPPSGGQLNNVMREHSQINSNLMVTLNRDVSDAFNIDFTVGNEFYNVRNRNISSSGSDFVIGGFHHISNAASQNTNQSLSRNRVVGFYSSIDLSWQNSVYLTITGRNDIVSNMPSGNRSFFYPSLGLGVVFTDFLQIPENLLSFGKIRASIAQVGQAGPAHSDRAVFNSGGATGGFSWPYQGLNAFSQSNSLNSSDLRTENTTTFETGVDLRFFGGRLDVDYTFYDSQSDGQIYRVPIAFSTGFSSELRNAGKMSVRGHELMIDIIPIQTDNIQWSFATNYTKYINTVEELADGINELELGGFRTTQVAIEGERYPSLRGTGYARDPGTGEVVVDGREYLPNGNPNPTYGMPLRAPNEVILGSAQPDFEVGFTNRLSFRNITLSAQVDWRQGGHFSSGQNRLGRLYGVNIETGNREEDYVFPGRKGYFQDGELIVEGINDITIQRGQTFWQSNQDPINESNVFEATYIRLREVRISYDLPSNLLSSLGIRSSTIYFIGTNLWTRADVPHFDPEMFNNSDTEQYNSYPQTKGFGGGVKIDF